MASSARGCCAVSLADNTARSAVEEFETDGIDALAEISGGACARQSPAA
ncbi:MAG TPA: hypothetical protein VKA18_13250 [Alphaproteobacteria bacterium]|nr:hypothetical protein [Alphaproteobacteria bacterium]